MVDAAQVDVWLARDPELRDPPLLAKFASVLSPDEAQRVERMQYPEGRHQMLVTRALVRNVLSHYVPAVPAADWRFDRGELGRPSVARAMPAAARALHFNVAHTRGLVVMAVGRMPEIGVDVERIDPGVRLAVARRYFSAPEVAALDALPPGEQPRRFQRLWTLKEAYLKALGTGISGGLGSMTFHFEKGVRFERQGDPEAGCWQFHEFEIGAEYLAAVAGRTAVDAPLTVSLRDYPAGAT
ncbi:MAG TPA: 4'-phosphopantetheinyl transferase superfamily protein [Steroidobacteraceae bacterium]|nr:4'-phosphopantetheinyl transferase superfamily protein [Steroidobacteraceae bacterium]